MTLAEKIAALKKTNPEVAEVLAEVLAQKEAAEERANRAKQIAMDATSALDYAKRKAEKSSVEERREAKIIAAQQLAAAREAVVSIAEEQKKQDKQQKVKVTTTETRDQGVYNGELKDGFGISINGVYYFLPANVEVEVPECVATFLKTRNEDLKKDRVRSLLLQAYKTYDEVNFGWQR